MIVKKMLVQTMILLAGGGSLFAQSPYKKGQYKLSGQISGLSSQKPQKVYLQGFSKNVRYDSCVVNNGTFQFAGEIMEPEWVEIRFTPATADTSTKEGSRIKLVNLFLETGNTSVVIDAAQPPEDIIVKGSDVSNEYLAFARKHKKLIESKIENIDSYYRIKTLAGDDAKMPLEYSSALQAIESRLDSIDAEKSNALSDYIATHPNSYFALWELAQDFRRGLPFEKVDTMFKRFSKPMKATLIAKVMKDKIQEERMFAIGNKLPHFILKDEKGTDVSSAGLKDKYVLIDFWASWCFPCRREGPFLKAAYEKYAAKGFEVLGVSIDQNESSWKKALKEDELPWINVIDNGNVATEYKIRQVPTNFLLDKTGRIIARNLRGEEVQKKLADIFGK